MELTSQELNFIYKALEQTQIQGKDAKFTANLLLKIGTEINAIQVRQQEAEQKRIAQLYAIQNPEPEEESKKPGRPKSN